MGWPFKNESNWHLWIIKKNWINDRTYPENKWPETQAEYSSANSNQLDKDAGVNTEEKTEDTSVNNKKQDEDASVNTKEEFSDAISCKSVNAE